MPPKGARCGPTVRRRGTLSAPTALFGSLLLFLYDFFGEDFCKNLSGTNGGGGRRGAGRWEVVGGLHAG